MELSEKKKVIIVTAVLVVIAVVSFFWIAGIASSEENFDGTYKSLDDKRVTVTELMGVTAASSAAISLLPGDAGTPIANQLMDLSGYFMIILAAIFFEKWMVTLTGLLAFKIMIPLACGFLIIAQFFEGERIKTLGINLFLVGLMIFSVIPASTIVTEKIDESYQASIQQTIDESKEHTKKIRKAASKSEESKWYKKVWNKVKSGAQETIEQFETILNKITEYIAVLIVTSCVIPIAVILFFIWLVKLVTGINIKLPRFRASKLVNRIKDEFDEFDDLD